MFAFLSDFLQNRHIDLYSALPLSACKIEKGYLLERAGIQSGTVIVIALPYYTEACDCADRNLSRYSVARDYHLYFSRLFDELIPALQEKFPNNRFAGFADHSPISEIEAAAKAGLGVIGKNHLLITERYSSFVFLGEVITDAILPASYGEIRTCRGCGACQSACPSAECGGCLSALTQKKGELTHAEIDALRRFGSAWGCDICQEVCPYTIAARRAGTLYSPIPFFSTDAIPHLTRAQLDEMTDEDFSQRAYAWRGRNTIRRNLTLLENDERKGDSKC